MSGNLPDVTDANFQAEVLDSDEPVLVDFWAPWCGPCRVVHPILEEMANERDDVKIVTLNIDENQDTASAYDVLSIPTMILFKGGEPPSGSSARCRRSGSRPSSSRRSPEPSGRDQRLEDRRRRDRRPRAGVPPVRHAAESSRPVHESERGPRDGRWCGPATDCPYRAQAGMTGSPSARPRLRGTGRPSGYSPSNSNVTQSATRPTHPMRCESASIRRTGACPATSTTSTQDAARAVGAQVDAACRSSTGPMMRLAYSGAPDADHDDRSLNAEWLRAALDAVLSGEEPPPTADARPRARSIKWRGLKPSPGTQVGAADARSAARGPRSSPRRRSPAS